KDGIAPLEGVIETDWLPFSFTMNWQLTRAGAVVFEKDEPFCFFTLINYQALKDVAPEILPIEDVPERHAHCLAWPSKRKDFNRRLLIEDPQAVRQAWQKWYTRGETPAGEHRNPAHLTKLSLMAPRPKPNQSTGS